MATVFDDLLGRYFTASLFSFIDEQLNPLPNRRLSPAEWDAECRLLDHLRTSTDQELAPMRVALFTAVPQSASNRLHMGSAAIASACLLRNAPELFRRHPLLSPRMEQRFLHALSVVTYAYVAEDHVKQSVLRLAGPSLSEPGATAPDRPRPLADASLIDERQIQLLKARKRSFAARQLEVARNARLHTEEMVATAQVVDALLRPGCTEPRVADILRSAAQVGTHNGNNVGAQAVVLAHLHSLAPRFLSHLDLLSPAHNAAVMSELTSAIDLCLARYTDSGGSPHVANQIQALASDSLLAKAE